MDLRQLRYFVTVAEELHFGRAAKRLFISQPALSFDIKKLEGQLGVQLLARTNRKVNLTNAGEVLLAEALRLLQQVAETERLTVRAAQGLGLAGRVRVGFVNSMLYRGLPKTVQHFNQNHPAVDVVLKEMNTSEQIQALQQGQIDIGCAHWSNFPTGVVSQTMLKEPFICCLPADHRLAAEASIKVSRLARDPFILFPRAVSPHYHDKIVAICVAAGFSPEIRHEVRLWQTVVTMVEYGMGVALVPETLTHIGDHRVQFRPLDNVEETSEIRLIRKMGVEEPNIAHFMDYLLRMEPQ